MGRPIPFRVLSIVGVGLFATIGVVAARASAARPGRLAPRDSTFDLVVNTGVTLIIDTTSATLTDSHGQVLTFAGGDIFLDSLEVKNGGLILGQGPNPLRFFVNNSVKIGGSIRVNGQDAKDVNTLLTAGVLHQFGGKGTCSGGDGGTGNPDITQSSAKGGNGSGAKNAADLGGKGGESSLVAVSTTQPQTPCFEAEDYHPAGGGGGSYATTGEAGFDGTNGPYDMGGCKVADGKSAVDPTHHPLGGAAGALAFTNNSGTDDYLGLALQRKGVAAAGSTQTIIVPAGAGFVASDAGRYIGLVRKVGSWEDGSPFCIAAPDNPYACPRNKYVMRRISQVNLDGSAHLQFQTTAPIQAGDEYMVFGSGPLVAGELSKLRGGEGGGAGGNAIPSQTFPNPNYAQADHCGAGGGGGAGVLEIYCLGPVDLKIGTLFANGGRGAAGENTIGLDRIGGGSGGGSGGMIRVQSAVSIDTTSCNLNAVGGERGPGAFGSKMDPVLPTNAQGLGHGGRGGMGVVQLHAPFDDNGLPAIVFGFGMPAGTNFLPAPILGVPEFSEDALRQRQLWFGIK
jgi:hypothetical protein